MSISLFMRYSVKKSFLVNRYRHHKSTPSFKTLRIIVTVATGIMTVFETLVFIIKIVTKKVENHQWVASMLDRGDTGLEAYKPD